jgi:hypothetical protein
VKRQAFGVAAAALFGIVVTAAVAWLASQLAGQRIGLTDEPLSVASGLTPARHDATRRIHTGRARPALPKPATRRQTTSPAVSTRTATAPVPPASVQTTTPAPPASVQSTTPTRTVTVPRSTTASQASSTTSSSSSSRHDDSKDGGGGPKPRDD